MHSLGSQLGNNWEAGTAITTGRAQKSSVRRWLILLEVPVSMSNEGEELE